MLLNKFGDIEQAARYKINAISFQITSKVVLQSIPSDNVTKANAATIAK